MVENRGNAIRPVHAPRLGAALAAMPFVLVLAGVRYEWWRYPSPLAVVAEPATVILAVLGIAVVGALWILRCYRYAKRRRRLPFSVGFAPVLVAVSATAFALMPPPAETDFEDAHGDMTALAVSLLDRGAERAGPVEVGGTRFSSVFVEDGCVYFVDSGRSAVKSVGWVYTAECQRGNEWFARLDKVADDWYAFSRGR